MIKYSIEMFSFSPTMVLGEYSKIDNFNHEIEYITSNLFYIYKFGHSKESFGKCRLNNKEVFISNKTGEYLKFKLLSYDI